jgi:hypothetical protein
MPRIYDSSNDALDFCKGCFPKEEVAEKKFGDVTKTGEGPDGRGNCFGWDAEHPPYEATDYRCHKCRARLTEEDN